MQGTRVLSLLAAATLAITAAGVSQAKEKCSTKKCKYLKCAVERTSCLVEDGQSEKAYELLITEEKKFAKYRDYVLSLAMASLAHGDSAGALTALDAYLEDNPDDCLARSWLAWVYIHHGFTELTAELLEHESCREGDGELALRYELLETFLEIKNEQGDSAAFDAIDLDKIYEEDIQLYRFARSALLPYWTPPFTIRFAMQGGYTTNAMFGSAKDPAYAATKMDSPLLSHELAITLAPMFTRFFSPLLELTSNSLIFFFYEEEELYKGEEKEQRAFHSDPYDFTSFDFGVRTGLKFFKPAKMFPSFFMGYRGDVLFLNMEDIYDLSPPIIFYEGHRAEIELAPWPELILFVGGGKRFFREDVRTRWELDAGLGLQKSVFGWLTLMTATSVRRHWTDREMYDLVGASVLGSAVFHIPRGLQLRTMASLHIDRYDSSDGMFDLEKPNVERHDTTVKLSAEFLTMSIKGIRFSLRYEFSDKISTIDVFSFMDHRILLRISLYYGFDFLGAKKSKKKHIPLDYGLEVSAAGEMEGIQDLLRTDEHVRGGPGCGCME